MSIAAEIRRLRRGDAPQPLMGLAALMTKVFRGEDLAGLRSQLIARADRDAGDAVALMDLSTLMQLHQHREIGLAIQDEALQIQRLFHLPATRTPAAIRLLAIMAPGDISANTPLEFLVEDSDIALDMLYVVPGEPFPAVVPEHDLLMIAAGESEQNRPLLQQLAGVTATWSRPVLNLPQHILDLSRDRACELLRYAQGVMMPVSARVERATLEAIGREAQSLRSVLPDAVYPIIVRPLDSHAGRGLARIDTPAHIGDYLQSMGEAEFYIARFVDYRSADGLYRKYRVVLIDGKPYASHMAISPRWMIHYLNAPMLESASHRAEEERFMADFDDDFALRNEEALCAIAERSGLDYLVIDCGETRDGELLVFEIDNSAVVHAMDPVDLFPYKQAQMHKVFVAFHAMLAGANAQPAFELPQQYGTLPVAY